MPKIQLVADFFNKIGTFQASTGVRLMSAMALTSRIQFANDNGVVFTQAARRRFLISVIFDFRSPSLSKSLDRMERCAAEIITPTRP